MSGWTSARPASEAQQLLQEAGVPAHQVQNAPECRDDPQLAHRGHFVEVSHPTHGTVFVEGSRFRLSATPASVTRAGPTYGQDVYEILSGLLGYDDDRIADLAATGMLE